MKEESNPIFKRDGLPCIKVVVVMLCLALFVALAAIVALAVSLGVILSFNTGGGNYCIIFLFAIVRIL